MSAAKYELDREMKSFRNELDAKICYEEFSGECYLHEEELVVICHQPDDSGVWVDEEDGNEKFVKIKDLYVTADKRESIQAMRKNYN